MSALLVLLCCISAPKLPVLDFEESKVGDVGMLSEFIVPIGGGWSISHACEVFQIVDENSMLLKVVTLSSGLGNSSRGVDIVLVRTKTNGLADGQKFTSKLLWNIAGTYKYTSTSGSVKTVFALEELNKDQFLADIEKKHQKEAAQKAQEAKEQAAARWRAKFEKTKRTWTDITGKHKVVATYYAFQPGKVKLQKADQSVITVPLAKLSDDGRRLALKIARERGELGRRN